MKHTWTDLQLDLTRKKVRTDGYVWVWCPDHHRAITEGYGAGWVREHIVVYEYFNGIKVHKEDVIHHLDGNRKHNSPNNLILLSNADHTKLHEWIKGSTQIIETPKKETGYCKICMKWLDSRLQHVYCSAKCHGMGNRRHKGSCNQKQRPSLDSLIEEIKQASFSEVGRKYGVSDNAIRKWLLGYGMTREEIKGLTDMSKITKRCQKGEYLFAPPKKN